MNGPPVDTPPMPIRVVAWRPIHKGPVVGSCDIILGRSLEVSGILVLQSDNGKIWVSFPGEPRIGADDKVIRDTRGKKQYNTILKWTDRGPGDRFKNSVLSAITAQFGDGALLGERPA